MEQGKRLKTEQEQQTKELEKASQDEAEACFVYELNEGKRSYRALHGDEGNIRALNAPTNKYLRLTWHRSEHQGANDTYVGPENEPAGSCSCRVRCGI